MSTDTPAQRQISIVPSSPRYAEQMQDLMHLVYHTTRENPDGTFTAAMFRRHRELFPEGQFIALDAGRVIGLTASMRIAFDPEHPFIEAWMETISDGWLHRHDPQAEWMYGVESCVHPDYRSFGIGGKLMEARYDVAKALNLRGMVAGSDIVDYDKIADQVTPAGYLQGVISGKYWDNNLSKQLKKGFKAGALIPNYLPEPGALGWGVVIVWNNPDFDPTRPMVSAPIQPRRYRITMRSAITRPAP
ncbi:MAG TPA: GNAT family N-acetyltransferase [Phototrophicaceae bacterium]|nr:GNAT family N-acetyltransferase [Phototrophicaceae bacterium]